MAGLDKSKVSGEGKASNEANTPPEGTTEAGKAADFVKDILSQAAEADAAKPSSSKAGETTNVMAGIEALLKSHSDKMDEHVAGIKAARDEAEAKAKSAKTWGIIGLVSAVVSAAAAGYAAYTVSQTGTNEKELASDVE